MKWLILRHIIWIYSTINVSRVMRGIRKFCQRGFNFDNVFFCSYVDEGREDSSTTISGLSSAGQRNAKRH